MFDKIKTAAKVGEELARVKDKVITQSQSVDELSLKVTEMQHGVEQFMEQQKAIISEQKRLITQFQKDRLSLAEQIEDMKQEVYNFKMIKGQLQNNLLDMFEEELKTHLAEHTNNLAHDAEKYEGVKSKISESVTHLAALNMQITELRKVVAQVKEKDFDFEKVTQKFARYEREKQELLDRLDKAERVAARMIRR